MLELLKGVLTIHNATEENLVYPAINKVAGGKLESQHLYHETAEADVLFFELDGLLKEGDDEQFARKAVKFRRPCCTTSTRKRIRRFRAWKKTPIRRTRRP